ncbi:MAG: peptidyl-prolyl cis-trans isomerase [Planctomycetota bacterium]|jgi:hypothetical protein
MSYKIIFRIAFCVFLFTIVSCSTPQTTPDVSAGIDNASEVVPDNLANKEPSDSVNTGEVIISLGDKKLTRQEINWLSPSAGNPKTIAKAANWWLETELLSAEAEKRGITNQTKTKFEIDMKKKEIFARALISKVQESIEVGDEEIRAYYDKNKDIDPTLQRLSRTSFSHITSKTLEEAEAVLERIKAGEHINELAEQLSIHRDAQGRGVVREYPEHMIKQLFGDEFFEAISTAKKDELIGPVKGKDNAYEIARHEGITESRSLSFLMAKNKIRLRLRRTKSNEVITALINSLKNEATDKIVRSSLITQTDETADTSALEDNENPDNDSKQ